MSSSREADVSVVVPVLNAARTLSRCLQALSELDPAPREILLVDNGSSDGSPALMHDFARARPHVRVLEESQRGAAAARNRGVFSAAAEIIAFTDADCSPARDWLARLTAPFSAASVSGAAGRISSGPSGSTIELFSALYTLRLPDVPSRHETWTPRRGGFPTANFAVRREMALELGGFDADVLLYGEDYDFCARLYARGGVIAYTPQAFVTHHHRERVSGLLRQAFGFGRAHAYMMRRHGRGLLWIDLPFRSLAWKRSPIAAWIDLSSADKKIVLIALSATISPQLLWALALYGGYLVFSGRRRAREADLPASIAVSLGLATLLVLKSAAMTAGRFWGAWRYRTFCI